MKRAHEIFEEESLSLSLETSEHWSKHLMIVYPQVYAMIIRAMEKYAAQVKGEDKLKDATPELLEALEAMVKNYWGFSYTESDKDMFRDQYPDSAIVKAESAIKKATT